MLFTGDVTSQALRKMVGEIPTDPNQIGQYVPGIGLTETIEELHRYQWKVSVRLNSVETRIGGKNEILRREGPDHTKQNSFGRTDHDVTHQGYLPPLLNGFELVIRKRQSLSAFVPEIFHFTEAE